MADQESARGQDTAQPYLPPVPPAAMSTSQLPADVSPFVGRVAELRALHSQSLQETPNRSKVIVIFGKRGVGKSTLAIHFAHQIKANYPDAQLYANVGLWNSPHVGLNNPTNEDRAIDILTGFLRALGIQGEAMPTSLSEKVNLYRSLLANRSVLIVIDGASAAGLVEPLIPASSSCLVLVTSLSSLIGLQPNRLPLDVMDISSAVELLAARAGSDKIGNEPTAAKEVVERCGLLPLAIVIAGARLATRATWSVNSLAERLTNNKSSILDELRHGDTEVAASFSLSYQALTPAEQTLFRRLAVFTGPHFDDTAAAPLMRPPHDGVSTMLERLVDLQLLEQAQWNDCYKFHDLLREFAKRHFEVDETEDSRRQCLLGVLEYYHQRLDRADQSLQPTSVESARAGATDPGHEERVASLRWLTRERENLVSAVQQSVVAHELDMAWRIAGSLASFFEVRAHYEDWLETHQFVLQYLDQSEHLRGRAVLTRSLGKLFYFQHKWARAVSNYRKALLLFQQLGQAREVGITLLYLGDTFRYQREWDSARNTLTASLHVLQSVGFRRGEAIALRSLGAVRRLTGDYREAIEEYDQALEIFREIGDDRWTAATRLSQADIYIDQIRPADARPILADCIQTFEEYGDRHWQALTLRSLGETSRLQQHYPEARQYFEQSLDILREDADRHWEAATVEDVGELYAAQGEWGKAKACYEECLGMLDDENRDRLVEARARKNLGVALDALGDTDGAKREWRMAWLSFVEQNAQEAIEVLGLLGDEA